jgi:hypothetical protein
MTGARIGRIMKHHIKALEDLIDFLHTIPDHDGHESVGAEMPERHEPMVHKMEHEPGSVKPLSAHGQSLDDEEMDLDHETDPAKLKEKVRARMMRGMGPGKR